MDKIVILDFGSQYSHLICKRIREFSVYAELLSYNTSYKDILKHDPKGIIFSGGPYSVYNYDAPMPDNMIFDSNLPLLGICYGHQLIVNKFGGKVKRANREYGSSLLSIDNNNNLLSGIGNSIRAWMSHGDEVDIVPTEFEIIGHTDRAKAAAIALVNKSIYGIQFHPEVVHTKLGTEILKNFVLNICNAKQNWTMEGFVETTVNKISKIEGNVLCGVSGGIDSTITALLIHRAIGNRLKCVFVNNGLLRYKEEIEIESMFKENFNVNFSTINAANQFMDKLKGVIDPEEKRKIVGAEFVRVFMDYTKKNGPFKWLAQGTLYPDVIESGISRGPADVIKSHHNVGGLPKKLDLDILEPLRELYKDEVRAIAKILNVPLKLIKRHPFPGPGLAVRIIGEVSRIKLDIVKVASKIIEEELMSVNLYDKVWQAFAVVGDDKAVGVVGDKRMYGNIVMVKVVDSIDAMTADWTRLPHDIMEKISNRITNEIDSVTWVTFSISSKPPATIEPQ